MRVLLLGFFLNENLALRIQHWFCWIIGDILKFLSNGLLVVKLILSHYLACISISRSCWLLLGSGIIVSLVSLARLPALFGSIFCRRPGDLLLLVCRRSIRARLSLSAFFLLATFTAVSVGSCQGWSDHACINALEVTGNA
jgi:hypothetical protein